MSEGSRRTIRILVNAFAVAALVGLLLLGGLWQWSGMEGADVILPPDPGCNLRAGPCVSRTPDGGTLEFAIEPRTLPLLQPLQLRVRLDGMDAEGVAVEITGVNMDMGYNRVELRLQSDGSYLGQGVLPVCTHREMTWQALVLVRSGRRQLAAPFQFYTRRP